MNNICALCHESKELKESHFIPKFVGKWLKKTSATGYLRNIDNINKRQQDIIKDYLLCNDCELIFSSWEKQFSEKIFIPFLDQKIYIAEYKDWLAKFCASLSWRTLIYIKNKNSNFENESEYFIGQINLAELNLRNFLLGKQDNLYQYEQHIFPLSEIDTPSKSLNLPSNINRYFLRSIGVDVLQGDNHIYIFTKLPTFLILGIVSSNFSSKMRASRVSLKQGIFRPSTLVMPEYLLGYMRNKALEIQEKRESMSDEQQNKIEKTALENLDKTADSKSFEAIMHDYNIFGNTIFK